MSRPEDLTSLRIEKRFAHAAEDVWSALADAEEARQWMPIPYTVLDAHVNGQVEIDGPLHITGRILAYDPPRVFEHEFLVAPSQMAPAGENAVLRYEIRPDGDGCLLIVTLTRLTRGTARILAKGMAGGFDRLNAHLQARKKAAAKSVHPGDRLPGRG